MKLCQDSITLSEEYNYMTEDNSVHNSDKEEDPTDKMDSELKTNFSKVRVGSACNINEET